jgi:methylated-DNA-[protein]-cysteine S-methyltransferase
VISTWYAPIDTPLGEGFYAYTDRGVVAITIGTESAFLADARRQLGHTPERRDPSPEFAERVAQGIARRDGTMVDWESLPGFQRKVLEGCAKIPWGQVQSYGDLALVIGAPGAARAVGTALAKNPIPLLIPCHRVVRAGGDLGGYGLGGTATKERLINDESGTAPLF